LKIVDLIYVIKECTYEQAGTVTNLNWLFQ